MTIPEQQLSTWSHQGSVTQSSSTYNSVKDVLEATTTPYYHKNYSVFLQGSYGNDTNIFSESDVDIVIRLDSTFFRDIGNLNQTQQSLYLSEMTVASYSFNEFKRDVISVLTTAYGSDVKVGEKAIQIAARGGRRKVDVVVALQYRKYSAYLGIANQSYVEGIQFKTTRGVEIINYPKQHSANLTQKHQASGTGLKPLVRILKNMRRYMIEADFLEEGVAPSYYIEGLLYNVPPDKFTYTYSETFVNSINWIFQTDRDRFVCANQHYPLCDQYSPVTWRAEQRDKFIDAAIRLWNTW